MDDRKERLRKRLDEARDDLLAAVGELTAARAAQTTSNAGWTVQDVLAHLAGAERGHQQVIRALLVGQTAGRPGFDLDAFNQADVAARQGWTAAQVLADLAAGRADTLALLDSVREDELGRAGYHPGGFDATIEDTFRVIAIHERRHAREIRAALAGLVTAL